MLPAAGEGACMAKPAPAVEAAKPDATAEAAAPAAKAGGRRKLILLAAPVVVLAGAGGGLWFTGILPRLLGMHSAKAEDEASKPPPQPIYVDLPELIANLNSNPQR